MRMMDALLGAEGSRSILYQALWATVVGVMAFVPTIPFAQSIVQMDYGVYLSDFEVDLDRDGIADGLSVYGTWGDRAQSLQAAGATLSIDSSRKVSGQRSQRIVFQRNSGSEGRLTVRYDAVTERRYVQPPVGTPMLVRLHLRAENVSGIGYQVRVLSGARWYTLYQSTAPDTPGWQPISMIIPCEASEQGAPTLRIYIEFSLEAGAARGQFWIDSLQVLAQPISIPNRARPNPIKMGMYNGRPNDYLEFAEVPLTLALFGMGEQWGAERLLPGVQRMLYYHANKTYAREDYWSRDLYDYYDCNLNHPDWFLVDSSGNRLRETRERYLYQNAYYIDPGHPDAQNRAAERLVMLVRDRGVIPDWIFLDGWNGRLDSQQYPTWEAILPAWRSLAQRLSPVIRTTLGCKVMVNSASQIGLYVDNNYGTQWIEFIDGVMMEGALIIYNWSTQQYEYRSYRSTRYPRRFKDSSWITTRDAVNAYPDKYWILQVQCDPNNREMVRYAVASYLVMMHDRCVLAFDDRPNDGEHTFRAFNLLPELFVPLGNATGSYRIEQGTEPEGALFARDFQYGLVLVNPTENRTFEYRTSRAYKDWDGRLVPAGSVLTIQPRQGVVLYAAPEIVVSLSPTRITALPGETITLSVRVENRGLTDATDVQVRVPLPSGLTFVSGSGVSFNGGQVGWTLDRLRPGESATRSFQARVE
jgi:uncharacterized repeat protein (TIGR01451 family)